MTKVKIGYDKCEKVTYLLFSALLFSKSLAQLDSVQQKLSTNLANNETLLKETQTQFATNIGNIQENFQNVEERLSKLKK